VAAYSRLGEHGALWLCISGAGLLVDRGGRATYARAARTVAAAYVANTAIKFAARRRRPELPGLPPLLPTISRLSYPSAHAATSVGAARVLSERLPAAALGGAAAIMALSRPYLGLHYPSDSLAGAALGVALAELVP
jgi:decaprenylphosphoryl-5-phosphoribose phosphatase